MKKPPGQRTKIPKHQIDDKLPTVKKSNFFTASEAIGFADIQGRPMRGTPFGELAGAEAVVEHGG